MRTFLLWLGWASVVGSIGDGLIAALALVVAGNAGWALPGPSVEALLAGHLPALVWVKSVAVWTMPGGLVAWLFALPALVYFPARIVMSALIGWAAFVAARRLAPRPPRAVA